MAGSIPGGGLPLRSVAERTEDANRKSSCKMIQRVGDRDKESWSIKDIAFTIPANPMSDRVQMVLTKEATPPRRDVIGIARLGHGYFPSGITGQMPTITTSSFEHNNFVIEEWTE